MTTSKPRYIWRVYRTRLPWVLQQHQDNIKYSGIKSAQQEYTPTTCSKLFSCRLVSHRVASLLPRWSFNQYACTRRRTPCPGFAHLVARSSGAGICRDEEYLSIELSQLKTHSTLQGLLWISAYLIKEFHVLREPHVHYHTYKSLLS
jgi:hypothetical protein